MASDDCCRYHIDEDIDNGRTEASLAAEVTVKASSMATAVIIFNRTSASYSTAGLDYGRRLGLR